MEYKINYQIGFTHITWDATPMIVIDDSIRANEYEFTTQGEIA